MGLRTQSAPHPRAATGPGGNGQLPVLSLRLGCVFSLDALPGFPTAASPAASAHHYALSQWDLVQEASQTPSPPGHSRNASPGALSLSNLQKTLSMSQDGSFWRVPRKLPGHGDLQLCPETLCSWGRGGTSLRLIQHRCSHWPPARAPRPPALVVVMGTIQLDGYVYSWEGGAPGWLQE